MAAKLRLNKRVRQGWAELRALITCILENGQESVFECKEHYRVTVESGDPDAEEPSPETCPCEGCTAVRNAWAAIAWIDQRID